MIQPTDVARYGKWRDIFVSPTFMLLPTLISLAGILLGEKALLPCIIINGELFGLMLFLSPDLSAVLMPMMGVLMNGTAFVGRWDIFVSYIIPWGIPIMVAFVYHFWRYRRPVRPGVTLGAYLFVSVAVALGGLFVITWKETTSEGGLYHVLGLSLGLVLLYLILAPDLKEPKRYDARRHFLWCMLYVGLLGCAIQFFPFLQVLRESGNMTVYLSNFKSRNNVCNLLVMTLPAPFFFAKDTKALYGKLFALLLGLLFYARMIMTAARTGWIFGAVLLLVCIVWLFYGKQDWMAKGVLLAVFALCIPLLVHWRGAISSFLHIRFAFDSGHLFSHDEARLRLFLLSLKHFCDHPLFGVGLATMSTAADAGRAMGCISWYHLYLPQIYASMGICGCFAYLYQGWVRFRLCFFRPDTLTRALSLCYLGLFLYSQTDPGEFIPIPFAFLALWLFLLLEGRYEAEKGLSLSLFRPLSPFGKGRGSSLPRDSVAEG